MASDIEKWLAERKPRKDWTVELNSPSVMSYRARVLVSGACVADIGDRAVAAAFKKFVDEEPTKLAVIEAAARLIEADPSVLCPVCGATKRENHEPGCEWEALIVALTALTEAR